MRDIFISYKAEDRPRAQVIAEALEQHGFSVWWDRIIPPGKTFDQVIEENLRSAKCVLALWSKGSVQSEWVKIEASEGARRKVLVPVMIEEAEIPFEFRRIQAANLIDWKGTLPDPQFDEPHHETIKKKIHEMDEKRESHETPMNRNRIIIYALIAVIIAGVLFSILVPGTRNNEEQNNITPTPGPIITPGITTPGMPPDLHYPAVNPAIRTILYERGAVWAENPSEAIDILKRDLLWLLQYESSELEANQQEIREMIIQMIEQQDQHAQT